MVPFTDYIPQFFYLVVHNFAQKNIIKRFGPLKFKVQRDMSLMRLASSFVQLYASEIPEFWFFSSAWFLLISDHNAYAEPQNFMTYFSPLYKFCPSVLDVIAICRKVQIGSDNFFCKHFLVLHIYYRVNLLLKLVPPDFATQRMR